MIGVPDQLDDPMIDSVVETMTVPIGQVGNNPVMVAWALGGMPTRCVLRNTGAVDAFLSFDVETIRGKVTAVGILSGGGIYLLPAGTEDVFYIAPGQTMFAVSNAPGATTVTAALSEIVALGEASGGPSAGSITGLRQSFIYTATGVEGATFTVTLPAVRPDNNYVVHMTQQVGALTTMAVDTLTTTNFRVRMGAPPAANDIIMFTVMERTS